MVLQYVGELIEAVLALIGRLDPKHVTLLGSTSEAAEAQADTLLEASGQEEQS